MERQNKRGVSGNAQVLARYGYALACELFDFGNQRPGVDHHPVADDGKLAGPHDARRQQRKLVGDAINDKSMARIVAALKPHYHIGALGQPVHQLSLAFIAPLGPDHRHIGHSKLLSDMRTAPGRISLRSRCEVIHETRAGANATLNSSPPACSGAKSPCNQI